MTKNQSAINKNYKLRVTPEESEAVQKVCFENWIDWGNGGAYEVMSNRLPYLFVNSEHSELTWIWESSLGDENYFEDHRFTEITPAEFIKKFGNLDDKYLSFKRMENCVQEVGLESPKSETTTASTTELPEGIEYVKIKTWEYIKKDNSKWSKCPTRYEKGDDWYTEDTVSFGGVEMKVDDFLEIAKGAKSLEASHRRNFPKK